MKQKAKNTYPVLVNDIDDNNKLPVILPVVDEGDSSDLYEPLERLQKTIKCISSNLNIKSQSSEMRKTSENLPFSTI